ncbi:dipeptide ABC transporter ATP-binding protein [Cohnella abietis]|uniref:ABC transporter domain-containing protein n=1 Tax=Cohnella abietis TaxID=2507935 RepID=A0A3T1CZ93_9BACL|nr:ABC transporter ATP-binding protein [Cohnella abietis]BBI31131.1 hypothetical protein KCTCHS21_05300 [Cohnella abietis]
MQPLLKINKLSIKFKTIKGNLEAVQGMELDIHRGEIVSLVGESGSGKTVTSLAILQLFDKAQGYSLSGEINWNDVDIASVSKKDLNRLRGKKIAMIFQDPMTALDPLFTIGSQITEVIIRHLGLSRRAAEDQAISLLKKVGIPEAHLRVKQFPHELSGGMRQRAMIAMALACGPELLIADEPTTALDVTVQAQILHLLRELQREMGLSILLITHDLGVAAQMADRVAVMYAGKIVEQGTAQELFDQPWHPYTEGLIRSIPTLDGNRNERLYAIEGAIPHLLDLPEGCRFHPRCPYATEICRREEPELPTGNGRVAACWNTELLKEASRSDAPSKSKSVIVEIPASQDKEVEREGVQPLIQVERVSKSFTVRNQGIMRKKLDVRAVDEVSFDIYGGETFGLVGESGSGKTTLGRLVLQLEKADSGRVLFDGQDLLSMSSKEIREQRRDMQIIFQDPFSSFDPRWRVSDIISEPLKVHNLLDAQSRRDKVSEVMRMVGLNPAWQDRYPHEFSGGQRQRIGIARAIIMQPRFIVADEAVSALDVSVQSQVINLMQDLQRDLGLTYLFIAHGLQVVRHISTRVGVMYSGRLVEIAPSAELFIRPTHHYTKALIQGVPSIDPQSRKPFALLQGEPPSLVNPPEGCRFQTRCPAVSARCKQESPQLRKIGPDHYVACHDPLH